MIKSIGTDEPHPFIRAFTVDSQQRWVSHIATLIKMKDGNSHIFDWHATLNVNDPLIFRTFFDWDNKIGSGAFSCFGCFKLNS